MTVAVYEWDERCIRRLLAQVLIAALEDLDRPTQKESAQAFFASEHLDWVADALDLDSKHIRRRVAEGINSRLLRSARRARKGRNGGAVAQRAARLVECQTSQTSARLGSA
jgi:hypothetical protein